MTLDFRAESDSDVDMSKSRLNNNREIKYPVLVGKEMRDKKLGRDFKIGQQGMYSQFNRIVKGHVINSHKKFRFIVYQKNKSYLI